MARSSRGSPVDSGPSPLAAEPARVAIRPALVRPVSSTHRTRRSRSGRHCFVTRCSSAGTATPVDGPGIVAHDVVPQGVELAALSPAPRDHLSVDDPQPRHLLRQQPAGAEFRQRAQCPRWSDLVGPTSRGLAVGEPEKGRTTGLVTRAAGRSPRRVGVSTVSIVAVSPGSRARTWAYGSAAPADGTQASRTTARIVRTETLVTRSATVAESPRRTCGWVRPGSAAPRTLARPPASQARSSSSSAPVSTASGSQGAHRRQSRPRSSGCRALPAVRAPANVIIAGRHRGEQRVQHRASAVTPSSSASCRSRTRCRNAGLATAFNVVGCHVATAGEPGGTPWPR